MTSNKNCLTSATVALAALVTALTLCLPANAHRGAILVYAQDGRLVTGFDDENPETGGPQMDVRTFSLQFSSSLAADSPAYLSMSAPPPDHDPLPQGTDLFWDFLPMTIDGHTSTLMYWDGQGGSPEDVDFGPIPHPDVTMGMFNLEDGVSSNVGEVDGLFPGALIGTTDDVGSGLRLHSHLWYFLDDGSDVTDPPAGIYLFAMHLRMESHATSRPFYIAAGTRGPEMLTALSAIAVPWIDARVDTLILDADFDFDGDVDGDDFLIWQSNFGTQTGATRMEGDTDGDGDVDGDDFLSWQSQFGTGLAGAGGAMVVPEPIAVASLFLASLTFLPFYRFRRNPI